MLSEPPFKDDNARFTTLPLTLIWSKLYGFISVRFSVASDKQGKRKSLFQGNYNENKTIHTWSDKGFVQL